MTSARIEPLSGAVEFEVMAPNVQIQWDPITNSGPIIFQMARYLVQDGVIRGDLLPSHAGNFTVQMEQILTRRFVPAEEGDNIYDPVTGADLSQVSVYGVMLIIKAAFDKLYNEQLIPPASP